MILNKLKGIYLNKMFFHNNKYNFIFVYTPLIVSAIPENIRHYILGGKDSEVNEYKNKKNILPNLCYSLNIKHAIGEDEWNNNYTFGIVRSPFDYLIDMYEFFTEGPPDRVAWCRGIKETKDAVKEQYRLKSRGFRNWLLNDRNYDYLHSSPFCGPRLTSQMVWLSEVNDVFCMEQTTPLLNKLFELSRITLPSFQGVPSQKDLKIKRASYFGRDNELIDLVTGSFKQEIERFGFSPE